MDTRFIVLLQENLQLMVDLKAAKQQLNSTKAELNMLRAQSVDSASFQPAIASVKDGHETAGSKRMRTPANKENSRNVADNPASSKNARTRRTESSRKQERL